VLVDVRHVHLKVCLDHNDGGGAFLIDTRHFHQPLNSYVAYSADQQKFGDIVIEVLDNSRKISM
jgi:hypothetical protein